MPAGFDALPVITICPKHGEIGDHGPCTAYQHAYVSTEVLTREADSLEFDVGHREWSNLDVAILLRRMAASSTTERPAMNEKENQ